ncbi:Alpha-taxilin [Pseudocercospora fuligena]|uniref:Alpha-taxilin n=1 Tax=Pseudocercospora fuligena TaxID=685502 RepID=A0A8H6RBK6_9PEZI|nr:Alpha-taxilin [Pseudocercospora fuligena]
MAAVANQHQQPVPASSSNARNSPSNAGDYSRDGSASDPSIAAPPPPPTTAPAPAKGGKGKAKKGSTNSTNPDDAHRALLSKISQLESTNAEDAHQNAEIEAEVKKANRDLSQLLNTMEPHQSKSDILQRKYSELLADMKRTEREHVKAKKRGDQLQKEKEEVSKERTKERSLKEKLEKLSRELTRENKKLKDDYRDLKENSSNRNEELHRKLEGLVVDVEEVILDKRAPERQSAEMEQDKLFREKFTSFLHQYELRELHFQSTLRVKDLEIQYHMARHDALKKAQESELSKSHQLTRQVSTFSQTENELRGQLNVYVEKFKQVEDTLNNSNDLFLTFRKEMEEMSKKTKRLEKENLNLTRKQEATNKNIFQMAEERSQSQQTIDRLTRDNEKLKKLCRAMQNNGYGNANMAQPGQAHAGADEFDEGLEGETESEYEDEEYDEDEEGEYDDDTEDDGLEVIEPRAPVRYGPVPPPPPPQDMPNGKARMPAPQPQQAQTVQVNGTQVNGQAIRH